MDSTPLVSSFLVRSLEKNLFVESKRFGGIGRQFQVSDTESTSRCIVVGFEIDIGRFEFASRYALLEHDIELAIGSTLKLGQAEVSPNEAEGVGSRLRCVSQGALWRSCRGDQPRKSLHNPEGSQHFRF